MVFVFLGGLTDEVHGFGAETSRSDRGLLVRSEAIRSFCGEACTWQAASYQCQQPVSAESSNTSLLWDEGDAAYVADPPLLEYTFLPTQH